VTSQTPVADAMRAILEDALTPGLLDLRDDSARHIGHAGHSGQGESHFHLTVVSERFQGMDRPSRHRLIYGLLAEFLKGPVHALSIKAMTGDEYKAP
jgi:BolA protein